MSPTPKKVHSHQKGTATGCQVIKFGKTNAAQSAQENQMEVLLKRYLAMAQAGRITCLGLYAITDGKLQRDTVGLEAGE